MTGEQATVTLAIPNQTQILHESGAWINRTAYRLHIRMPWAEIDDMVQQGILTALELRERYEPTRGVPFRIFIKPRVFGAMVDLSRQTGATKRREARYGAEIDIVVEDDCIAKIIAVEDAEALAEEIDRLPERERTVISLFYFDEMSNKEVAVIMKITEVQVVRSRKRALDLLARGLTGRSENTLEPASVSILEEVHK